MMRDQVPCGIFSLEMPQKQIAKRMITIKSQASLKQVQEGVISDKHMKRINDACEDIKEFPIYTVHNIKTFLIYVLTPELWFVNIRSNF
jgi:replicative DNA helicase